MKRLSNLVMMETCEVRNVHTPADMEIHDGSG